MDWKMYRGIWLTAGWTVLFVILIGTTKAQDSFYFLINPSSQDVLEGSEITLNCAVSRDKHIVYHWTMNDLPVQNTSRRYQDGTDLRILRVLREDDFGGFRCVATNTTTMISLKSTEARLNIMWIDQGGLQLKQPSDESAIVPGATVSLKCLIQGNPEPQFEWYKNKIRLFSSEDRVRFRDGARKVILMAVTSDDNGMYSCRAKNAAGHLDSSDSFMINVQGSDIPILDVSTFTREVIVKATEPATLHCRFDNSAVNSDWYHEGNILTNTSRRGGHNITVFSNGTLYFNMVRGRDAGTYKCVGISQQGKVQRFTSELKVAALEDLTAKSFEPRIPAHRATVVPVGERFELLCLPPNGFPAPTVRWLNPSNTYITNSGRVRIEDTSLVITYTEKEDTGNYTCVASNMAGNRTRKVQIVVSVAPTIIKGPSPTWVEEDEEAVMECRVTATPYPVTQIRWMKNNELLAQNRRFSVNQATGVLRVRDVFLSDAGEYACSVNTTGFPVVTSSPAPLTVRKKLKFKPRPINTKLELRSNAKIHCRAEGEGTLVVKWLKSGDMWNFPSHILDEGGTLVFTGVKKSDAGSYTCVATSSTQGVINATIHVDVVVKPWFRVKPQNDTAVEGSSVMLNCVAAGDPQPAVQWDKNGELIRNIDDGEKNRFQVQSNGSLFITEVYVEDQARFGCTAGNNGGFAREEMYLKVKSMDPNGPVEGSDIIHIDTHGQVVTGESGQTNTSAMKTVIIAVVSAVAYLVLVVTLVVVCSIRLLRKRRKKNVDNMVAVTENGEIKNPEQETLMGNQSRSSHSHTTRSDDVHSHVSGANSHFSGTSSHPSHSSSSRSKKRSSLHNFKFPRDDLQTIGMLGRGEYGDVFLAKAKNIKDGEAETLVVVKSLLSKDEHHQFEFRQEIDMFSKLDSEFVVRLMGVCRDREPQFMMTEYLEWGDLKQFLFTSRKESGKRLKIPALTIAQKVTMCNQVALGMEHIFTRRLVHKDVAARNVLLAPDLNVKVANLRLSRDFYSSEYYRYRDSVIPIRWMPHEAVLDDDLSTKSDVWAFGIFMWEVFSQGDMPFGDLSNEDLLQAMKSGDLLQPASLPAQQCPAELQTLMMRCWADCPKERPTFSEIVVLIGELTVDSDV
ncbi:inactive tyrosine-protein kinase 7 isoform X2 [Lingula anatina]|uniref:Inactive tyrosine-protein kinase 7 isoform X2 n=1 Tax=Lingula anatina TaxID=7574 RepID=A0A1S3HKF1_LINAN|nr:inactive tyrosine-protein kinase 7 isoform X2 [Lingula anatina]|eukprot:XP_013386585.1 inactive tyrosine-protein kinase 7 isoform X2 [Lingula anatina]